MKKELMMAAGALVLSTAAVSMPLTLQPGSDSKPDFHAMKRVADPGDRGTRMKAPSFLAEPEFASSKRPTIYGAVIYSKAWQEGDDYDQVHYCMSSFRPLTEMYPTTVMENPAFDISAGAYRDGMYYCVRFTEQEGEYNVWYQVFNAETWNLEKSIHSALRENIPVDFTLDETSGRIYGSWLSAGNGYDFGTLDTETGKKHKISHFNTNILSIAADGQGQLYGFGWTQGETYKLYSINKETGELTLIGDTGVTGRAFLHSATFDIKNNVLYWAPVCDDASTTSVLGTTILYKVDTTTGAATRAGRFMNDEEIAGMFIITPIADEDAPDTPSTLTLDFPQGALTGNVSFTAPRKTYGGKNLSGSLTYEVMLDGEVKATGNTTAGASVNASLTATRGTHTVSVAVSNSKGRGPIAKQDAFFGFDTSKAPVAPAAERVTDSSVKVSWTHSSESLNGGYLDASRLRYKVVRHPDEKVVAAAAQGNSVTDNIESPELTKYTYEITPSVDGLEGPSAVTDKIIIGTPLETPYLQTFDTAASFDLLTVISSRRPVFQWQWFEGEQCAREMDGDGTPEQKENDWLILPPLRLSPSQRYTFRFRYRTYGFPEQLEVAMGTKATREGMTDIIIPRTADLVNKEWQTMECNVTVPTEGTYYFGIHSLPGEERSGFYLFVDDISVEGWTYGVPAAPELSVTPRSDGSDGAEVAVTVPSLTFDGQQLGNVTAIEIRRNGQVVKTFTSSLTHGARLTFDDAEAPRGMTEYTAVARTAEGEGPAASQSLWVGTDIPSPVTDIRVAESAPGTVTLSWKAPAAGAHDGYIDAASLVYTITRLAADGSQAEEPVTVIGDTSKELVCTLKDRQELTSWSITAGNSFGTGEAALSDPVIIGNPYPVPFRESFASGKFESSPWLVTRDANGGNNGTWEINRNSSVLSPQDGDRGLITFVPCHYGEAATLTSPRISLAGGNSPLLTFYFYNNQDSSNELSVYALAGGQETLLGNVNVAQSTVANKSWVKVEFPLTQFVGDTPVQLAFKAVSGLYDTPLYVDNISITDSFVTDLAVKSVSAPFKVRSGSTGTVSVAVENAGSTAASAYTVRLLDEDDAVIGSLKCTDLAPRGTASYRFELKPDVTWEAEKILRAEVVCDGDQNLANNVSPAVTVHIEFPMWPSVTDLNGVVTTEGARLEWSAPDIDDFEPEPTTDDVETYTDFAITCDNAEMGDWKVIDVDGGEQTVAPVNTETGAVFEYPNVCAPHAFMVFNPAAAGLTVFDENGNPGAWAPHSGNKYFAAFSDTDMQNDDWLISPELSGDMQTVSFFVKAASAGYEETYEFLYSKEGTEIADFTRVAQRTAPNQWTEVSFSVPRGARYFAVRCTSADAFALLLDDFSFFPVDSSTEDPEILGYNIYRDKSRINGNEPVAVTNYLDATPAAGDNIYQVSAVYNFGESALSNAVTLNFDGGGVSGVAADGITVTAVNGGIRITGAAGRDITVCTPDGKVMVSTRAEADQTVIPLPGGIYIIDAAGHPRRILLR